MSWKVIKLNVYWSAEEADSVLTFIDELRDQILANYEDQIIAMRLEEHDALQTQLPLEQPEDF